MKYKCIKDFWMEDRLPKNTPAFSAGNVYEFYQVNGLDDLRTDNNNQGRMHYMPMSDINEHFELVEEEQMTALKWEEGKMYQLRIDMTEEFKTSNGMNEDIFNLIGYKTFMVEEIDRIERVTKLTGFSKDGLAIEYWFYPHEIKYFDLVEHTEEKQEMTSNRTEQEIVVEWFNKYIYVVENDSTVDDRLYVSSHSRQLSLETDLTDIIGEDIYTFIVGRYNLLHTEEETKRKQELLDKRAELELQLAQINKELGE